MYNPQRASPPPNQFSPIPAFNLDDDNFEPLWASASQPSQYTEGPSEPVEDNSPIEEVAPVSTSKDIIEGNGKKASGFWMEVTEYFYKKWANRKEATIRLTANGKIEFVLRLILKDHSKWKKFEMPKFYKSKKSSSKKSRTSKTTSQGNLDSAHIGLDLNDEATDSEDVDVQEVAPMGRDRA
ncbi:hypothetical protein Tco_0921106 [Tanacetum coccineum]